MSVRISELTAAGALARANLFPLVQGSATYKLTAGDLADWVQEQSFVTPQQFGAVGDGVTDDTTAIQDAIDALGSDGGFVFFPVANYLVSSTLTLANGNIMLIGCGGENAFTKITTNQATGHVFLFGSLTATQAIGTYGCGIAGFNIVSSVTRTANSYIVNASCNHFVARNIQMHGAFRGLTFSGYATAGCRVKDVKMWENINTGLLLGQGNPAPASAQGPVDLVVEDVWIAGNSTLDNSDVGVMVTCAGDITLRHVSTVYCENGLYIVPGSTQERIQALYVTESFWDSGLGTGILISPQGSSNVHLVSISNTWAATNTLNGINLDTANGNIKQVDIINCNASNNGANGILIGAAATDTNIIGGNQSANVGDGIRVAANADQFTIIGATAGPSGEFAGNTGYGINILAGNSDEYVITACRVTGNTAGTISDNGTGTVKNVTGNIGYVTEANGTSSIASGTTSIAVTHGLSKTPAAGDISINFTENPTNDPGNIWISNITSTQFTVNCRSNPGASNLDFSWGARVL